MPPLDIAGGVGVPMNLQPPTLFNEPVRLFVPCPGYDNVEDLNLYYYNGMEWRKACDADEVLPGGEGWMVPGSRANHNAADDPERDLSFIEIQVYHFSGVQAGSTSPSDDDPAPAVGSGSSDCFIDTLRGRK
jgi:hypothetical protein